MQRICNLREGLLVALMSIGTLTAEAAVGPFDRLNSINDSETEEEDLDLISKVQQNFQLANLKTQKLHYQLIESHLSAIQEFCVSDTITEDKKCKIPSGLVSGFVGAVSGLVTLKFIKLYYQQYTLIEIKKNFIIHREKLRGPLSTAIEQLEFVSRNLKLELISNGFSKELIVREMDTVIRILDTMDNEMYKILKINKAINTVPFPSNYLKFLNANTEKIINIMREFFIFGGFSGVSVQQIFDAHLMELKEKGLSTDNARKIRLTRLANLTKNASGALIFSSATFFFMSDASYLLSSESISSQLDELSHEINGIQDEIDQLEKLMDIAL